MWARPAAAPSENQASDAEHNEQADEKDDADDPENYFHLLLLCPVWDHFASPGVGEC